MDLGIKDKVALVTGGARGIGRAIAQRLADEGCRVAVADIDEAALADLPPDWRGVACDVTSQEQLEDMVLAISKEFGTVDILVNNAGIVSSDRLAETTVESWERIFRVNLTSAFTLCKLLLPAMKQQGWGRIVIVASMAGKVGGLTVSAAYSASKAGLISLTKSVAREGAPEVTSNAVAPAFIDTDMTPREIAHTMIKDIPVGRLGTAEEVAAAVAFLASDLAGFITGEIVDINGGLLMD